MPLTRNEYEMLTRRRSAAEVAMNKLRGAIEQYDDLESKANAAACKRAAASLAKAWANVGDAAAIIMSRK